VKNAALPFYQPKPKKEKDNSTANPKIAMGAGGIQ